MIEHKPYSIPVGEYTTPCPVTASLDIPFEEIVKILESGKIRHLPIIENDRPVGIISSRDVGLLTKHVEQKNIIAQDLMTPGPYLISPTLPLEKAAFYLSKYKIGSALVVDDDGKLTGIFTSTDALNALVEVIRGEVED